MANSNGDEENKNPTKSEDDFGLPDLDYRPLDKSDQGFDNATQQDSPLMEEFATEEEVEEFPRHEASNYIPEEKPKSKAPVFIALIIGLVVLTAAFLVWKYVVVPSNLKAKQEQEAKQEAKKAQEEAVRLANLRQEEERQRLAAEAVANAKPKEGTIEVLSSPTKRFYVVISSAVDADLTMDYAKKLSAKGVSSKLIPPFGKWKFNRLAIGDYDSFDAAQSQANVVKADYGNAVWVIRY